VPCRGLNNGKVVSNSWLSFDFAMEYLKKIIVIGASAGGIKALTDLISVIPGNLPTAIFIVLHLSKKSSSEIILQHLAKFTDYKCKVAVDNEAIMPGVIYIPPPDFHLVLKRDVIRLTKGPHENRWRPSIDVLFRSAAAAFDSRVIGIILSGMLDDGTSGMSAIKRSGGTCIVQEPEEAEFPDMPISVINNVEVDYRSTLSEMRYIIEDVFSKPAKNIPIPEDVKIEAKITERMTSSIDDMKKIGKHSNYICPDCGGGLWLINNEKNPRYRCFTGHVYTESLLLEKQAEELEESLWVSIRMMEERRNMLMNMAQRETENGSPLRREYQAGKSEELNVHIERLKDLLISIDKINDPGDGYK